MSWDEKASRAANPQCSLHRDCDHLMRGDHRPETFTAGARWQREALLADDVIERAARALYESSPRPWTWEEIIDGWRNKPYPDYPHTVDDLMAQARAALTAAIEGDQR